MSLKNLKRALHKKQPINLNDDEIKYSLKPIGKAHLLSNKKNKYNKKERDISSDSSTDSDTNTYSLEGNVSSDDISNDMSYDNDSNDSNEQDELYIKPKYKRVLCEICGKEYCTNNSGKHKATKHHQFYANMNKKLLRILTN